MAIAANRAIGYNFLFTHSFKSASLLKVFALLRTIYLIPLQNPM